MERVLKTSSNNKEFRPFFGTTHIPMPSSRLALVLVAAQSAIAILWIIHIHT